MFLQIFFYTVVAGIKVDLMSYNLFNEWKKIHQLLLIQHIIFIQIIIYATFCETVHTLAIK